MALILPILDPRVSIYINLENKDPDPSALCIRNSEGYSIIVPKSKLIDMFPESMLANMLSLDKDATEIQLDQKCVTVDVLYILAYIMSEQKLPSQSCSGLDEASRYLNIQLLEVLNDPMYSEFRAIWDMPVRSDPAIEKFMEPGRF